MALTHGTIASLAAVGLLALLAPAMDAGAAPASGVTCEIRMVESGGGVTIKGIVHAAKTTSGSYSLKIANAGGGGSSSINQGGDFSLGAGESTVVGETMLGNADGLRARLSVTTAAGTTSCSR